MSHVTKSWARARCGLMHTSFNESWPFVLLELEVLGSVSIR